MNQPEFKANARKRGKTRASKARWVLILFLISWESGAPNQSQNLVKQKQSKEKSLSTLDWKLLYYVLIINGHSGHH